MAYLIVQILFRIKLAKIEEFRKINKNVLLCF